MARPSKLSPEIQERICQLLRAGNVIEVASEASGISPATFYNWMNRGKMTGRANKPHRDFRVAVEQALADAEAILVARISKAAAAGSWRAACWLLERRNPDRWAPMSERKNARGDETEEANPLAAVEDELASRRAA